MANVNVRSLELMTHVRLSDDTLGHIEVFIMHFALLMHCD